KPEAAHAAPADKQKTGAAGLLSKTPVLFGGVMLLEAVVLFGGFKFIGGGKPAPAGAAELSTSDHEGHDGHDGHGEKSSGDRRKTAEVNVLDFKAPNHVNGRSFLYEVSISV